MKVIRAKANNTNRNHKGPLGMKFPMDCIKNIAFIVSWALCRPNEFGELRFTKKIINSVYFRFLWKSAGFVDTKQCKIECKGDVSKANRKFTEQFKVEAVKQITWRGYIIQEVVVMPGVSSKSLYLWLK